MDVFRLIYGYDDANEKIVVNFKCNLASKFGKTQRCETGTYLEIDHHDPTGDYDNDDDDNDIPTFKS